jgi:general secretion pathway protein M
MKLAALGPWWERGTRWWDERSLREQILVGTLAALAMLALLLVGVVRPLEATRARASADIRTYDMLAMRLRTAGPGLGNAQARGAPVDIIAQSAGVAGLSVQQIAPENGRTRVVFGDAPFETIVRWVAALERSSRLRVSEARIARTTNGTGGVSASFLIAG